MDEKIKFKDQIYRVSVSEKKFFEKNLKTKKIKEIEYFSKIDAVLKPEVGVEESYKLSMFFSEHRNILSKLALISLYSKKDNNGKVKKIISKIIKNEGMYHLIGSEVSLFDKKQVYNKAIVLLKQIQKSQKNKLFDMLVYYLYYNSDGVFREEIDEEFEIKKGLIYLNKQLSSVNFGFKYLWTWGPGIFEKSSTFALSSFLKRIEESAVKVDSDNSLLLFYRGQSKLPKIMNKKFNDVILNLVDSKQTYNLHYLKRICDDEYFYSKIGKHPNERISLTCSPGKLRTSFLELIEQDFSFINLLLIQMGDYSRERILRSMSYE